MQYEYYFENITENDLQSLQSLVNNSNVSATVVGASSGSAGITSIAFDQELTQTKLNRLITFLQNRVPQATFIRMEVLE